MRGKKEQERDEKECKIFLLFGGAAQSYNCQIFWKQGHMLAWVRKEKVNFEGAD